MIICNGFLSSTDRRGTSVIATPRFVQIDDGGVGEDPGMVEIMPGSSSAMAPMLKKTVYDWPMPPPAFTGGRLLYQRGDVVTLLSGDGQAGPPIANPFHIFRVLAPAEPLAATEISMGRMDFLTEDVTLFRRIQPTDVGATRTATWNSGLGQAQGYQDGSYGVGLQNTDPLSGLLRQGYYSAVTIQLGINEYSRSLIQELEGLIEYEGPVVLYEDPVALTKGDLLVNVDGRRLVVEDVIHKFQRYGVIIATIARAEQREPGDVTFGVS